MTRNRVARTIGLLTFLIIPARGAAAIGAPVPVSPGGPAESLAVRGSCPTFSWAATGEVAGFELAVYRLGAGEAGGVGAREVDRVLQVGLPAGARAWTPAEAPGWMPAGAPRRGQCLAPGQRYAWLIRAVGTEGPSSWSEPLLFEVGSPVDLEVREAIAVLRRYLERVDPESARALFASEGRAENAGAAGAAHAAGAPAFPPAELRARDADGGALGGVVPAGALAGQTDGSALGSDSGRVTRSGGQDPAATPSVSGFAAVRGELADVAGEAHGVIAVSNSPDGAAVAAENTAGGADLLIQGDGGSPSALVTEATLDRPSADDQSFDFVNSGAGQMMVSVDGVEVVTTATDADTLAALACSADEIAKWDGAAWICSVDDGPDTLGALACASGEIVRWNGAAWECSADVDTDTDTLGDLSCADTQVAQWNGAAWVCANVGTDTLASLTCDAEQVVHWTGSVWSCGQPTITRVTCSDTGSPASCTMSCAAGSVVWAGGCGSNTFDSLTDNTPTQSGGVATGWRCEAWDPLGTATVNGELYCVVQ